MRMHEIKQKMIAQMSAFTRAEKKIAEILLENPEAIEGVTLSQIARNSDSSEATFVRFCRKLGYDGFTAFKEAFTRENRREEIYPDAIETGDDINTILRKLYKKNMAVLSDTLAVGENNYEKATEALQKAAVIHFFGIGDACAITKLSCMRFRRIGVRCTAEEDIVSQMIIAANMGEQDMAVAVCSDGRTRSIVEVLKTAKAQGAATISITTKETSPLLAYTDIPLLIPVRDPASERNRIAKQITYQIILEALYLAYVSRMDMNTDEIMRATQAAIDSDKL